MLTKNELRMEGLKLAAIMQHPLTCSDAHVCIATFAYFWNFGGREQTICMPRPRRRVGKGLCCFPDKLDMAARS